MYAELRSWATVRQLEILDAIETHGSARKAAKALGVAKNTVDCAVASVRKKAAAERARLGHAPGHFDGGVAPGYQMGKVTIQRGPGGVERVWERQHPDDKMREEMMRTAIAALCEDVRGLAKPAKAPKTTNDKLCNLYTLTDCHVGMLAWGKETGADWDLKIAEQTLTGAMSHLVEAAPKAGLGVVLQLGDFLHFDSLDAVTPTHRNLLDADGRYSKVVQVAVRTLRHVIDQALRRHVRVIVVMAEGNHDMASSVWLRHLFTLLYENEPRVWVHDSEVPYYAVEHGINFLGFHHGHLKKKESLPSVFAATHREMWGRTKKTYIHTRHQHHVDEKEYPGAKVIQHPTIAARDAHSARGGYVSEREMSAITYHADFGQVARATVTPEMLTQ
jgi:hypothetical protein